MPLQRTTRSKGRLGNALYSAGRNVLKKVVLSFNGTCGGSMDGVTTPDRSLARYKEENAVDAK